MKEEEIAIQDTLFPILYPASRCEKAVTVITTAVKLLVDTGHCYRLSLLNGDDRPGMSRRRAADDRNV